MSKSIKLKNNNYWDSKGIVHNKELLKDILDTYKNYPIYYGEITASNGYNFNNIKNIVPSNVTRALIVVGVYSCAVSGAPKGAYNWGMLLCFKNTSNFNYFLDTQIYIPDSESGLFIKTRNQGRTGWAWKYIATTSKIEDYS